MSNRDVERQAAAEEPPEEEEQGAALEVAAATAAVAEVEVSKITPLQGSREAKRAAKKAEQEAAKRERKEKAAILAGLEKSMPKLSAILKAVPGFTPDVLASFLERFKSTALTEEEVVALVAPPKAEPRTSERRFRKRMIVARHGLKRWLRSQNLIFRLLYVIGWCSLVISSVVTSFMLKGVWTAFAIMSALAVVAAKIRFMIRDLKPKNMQIIDRGYNERKVQLQGLVETTQRWYATPPTSTEMERYRRDALGLVAGYVRDHRARYGSREILANLLVPDGVDFVVIGRSDGIRPVPQRYTREQCALVALAIETGEAQITGDLYANFPNTVQGKKYNSILVLPVWFQGSVVGAVSIDSQEKYHFDMDFDDLQVHLLPYVQLLAAGLPTAHDVGEPPVY